MILADWTLRRREEGKIDSGRDDPEKGQQKNRPTGNTAQLVKRIPSMSSSFSRGGRHPRQERPRARILSKKPDLDLLESVSR